MDTVVDRADIRGNPILVMSNFGDHALHHLFPTLDHGILPNLYDILFETLDEFEMELGCYPYLETIRGNFAQLARNKLREIDSQKLYRQVKTKAVNEETETCNETVNGISNGNAKTCNGEQQLCNGSRTILNGTTN